MPLSRKGRKVRRAMRKTYGIKKGDRIFFASEHRHPSWKSHKLFRK